MHLHHFEVPLGTSILNLFSGIVLEVSPFWKKLINNITARQESNFFPPFHWEISPSPSFLEHAAGPECSYFPDIQLNFKIATSRFVSVTQEVINATKKKKKDLKSIKDATKF